MRKQKAVVWKKQATPDRYGKFSFDEPLEIACRWDDSDNEYRDDKGDTKFSQTVLYPDRVLAVGDRAREGAMESDTPDDPSETTTFEVVKFEKTPNFKATETLYRAYLV